MREWKKYRVTYTKAAPAGNKSVVVVAQNSKQIRASFENVKRVTLVKTKRKR